MAKKKAINFTSKKKEANFMAFQHANPKARAAAAASPGNTPVKVKGKSVKVNHTASKSTKLATSKATGAKKPMKSTTSTKKKKKK